MVGDPKGKELVAAVGITDELRSNIPQIGVPGLTDGCVQTEEYQIVVETAIIGPLVGNAVANEGRDDPVPGKIAHSLGAVIAGAGNQQVLRRTLDHVNKKTGGCTAAVPI